MLFLSNNPLLILYWFNRTCFLIRKNLSSKFASWYVVWSEKWMLDLYLFFSREEALVERESYVTELNE